MRSGPACVRNRIKGGGVQLIVVSRLFAVVGVVAAALLSPLLTSPSASAAPCPDVELVFARGTFEPPGVGETGQAFVDSLRSKAGGKSIDVYPVNYPASLDFQTAADGVIDASNKVQAVAANCPDTKIVLGGYSQGAAVAGYLTADSVPVGYDTASGHHRADASRGRRPRRRGGALREAVERVPADDRQHRAADHGRPPLRGQDDGPVHPRGSDLLAGRQRQRRTHSVLGQRPDGSGRRPSLRVISASPSSVEAATAR